MSIVLILLLLLQPVFIIGRMNGPADIGEQNGDSIETSESESLKAKEDREGSVCTERSKQTRFSRNLTTHFENEGSGGSYFDGFDDHTGIETYKNVYPDDGRITMDWWHFNWTYRRSVTIGEGSGNNLTDHPVLITLNLSNFDYSDAKTNGGDLRFVDEHGVPVDHWIEVWNRSGDSRIWIKMPYLAAHDSASIWMYYGNQEAFSLSNGSATFDFFDDFDDGDISDWNNASGGIEGGGSEIIASSLQSASPPYSARLYGSRAGSWGTIVVDIYRTIYVPEGAKRVDLNVVHRYPGASAGTIYPEKTSVRINDVAKYGPSAANDTEWMSNSTNSFSDRGQIKLGLRLERHGWNTGTEAYFDNVRVRKYIGSEPSSEMGAEESKDEPFYIASQPIELPSSHLWDHLYIQKTEPPNTDICISVFDAGSSATVPGYENVSSHSLDLSQLNYMDIQRIFLKAFFIGSGASKPTLDSWGLEWKAEDTWRDSFVTGTKLRDTENLFVGGNISLSENTVMPGRNVTAIWHFDEIDCSIAKDVSGNSNDGMILGPEKCEGFFGNALYFDGIDDAVKAGISGGSSRFTVEMRIKPDLSPGDASRMLDRLFASSGSLGMYNNINESFLFTDRNDSWDVMGDLSEVASVYALLESSDGVIYAGTGPNGDVFKTVDGGESWLATGELTDATDVNSLLESSDGAIYASTSPEGKIYKTTNGGLSWNGSVEMGMPGTSGNCLLESKSGIIYSGIESGGGFVVRSQDRGESWESTGDLPIDVVSVNTLLETSDGVIYAGTSPNGRIFHSSDHGSTWIQTGECPNTVEINSLIETSRGVLLAGGYDLEARGNNPVVYRSPDKGITWAKVNVTGEDSIVHCLLEASDGTIYAGTGNTGQIFRSSDQGMTWTLSAIIPIEGDIWALLESTNGLIYSGTFVVSRTGGNVTNSSEQLFSDGEWIHLVFVYDGLMKKIYVNGRLSGSSEHTFSPDHTRFWIGGDAYAQESDGGYPVGSRNTSFGGAMDEVAVYDRPLSPMEVSRRAQDYRHESVFRSVNITLPDSKAWKNFTATRSVPDNTFLNISVHDSDTGEALCADNDTDQELSIDLMDINAIEHPSIYLRGYMRSNSTRTPVLFDWAVNWTPMGTPRLLREIGNITIMEDTPQNEILNISLYFEDIYSTSWSSSYSLEYIHDHTNITLELTNHTLSVPYLQDNWSGDISLVAKCTNIYGLAAASNVFHLFVTGIHDLPVWVTTPPSLSMDEDTSITTDHTLRSYVYDAENDALDFTVKCPNENLFTAIGSDKHIMVESMNDFYGDTELILTVYEVEEPDRYSRVTTSLTVIPVNDPPDVILSHPANNSILLERSVMLQWRVSDVDDDPDDISIDLYMGTSYPPGVHTMGIVGDNLAIDGLKDETTFFWYIKATDGESVEMPENGIRSFTINTSAKASVALSDPGPGAMVNTTGINFTWRADTSYPDTVYHVYLGPSPETMEEIGSTGERWLFYDSLEDKTTYWWEVIPYAGEIIGTCDSGVWNFTLDTDFEAVYILDLHAESYEIVLKAGDEGTINITLRNLGNCPLYIHLAPSGDLLEHVGMEQLVYIPIGGSHIFMVNITNTSEILAGSYKLNILATFQGGKREISISIRITENDITPPDDDDMDGADSTKKESILTRWWFPVAVIATLVIILLVILVVLRKRRSKGKAEPSTIKTGVKGREQFQGSGLDGSDRSEVRWEPDEKEEDEIGDSSDMPPLEDEPENIPGSDEPHSLEIDKDRSMISEVPYGHKLKKKAPEIARKMGVGKYRDEGKRGDAAEGDAGIPKVAPAGKSVTCGICFGIVKSGLPLVTCSCKKKYHVSCFERVGECPKCGLDMSGKIIDATESAAVEEGKSHDDSVSGSPEHAEPGVIDMPEDAPVAGKFPKYDEMDETQEKVRSEEYHIEI